MHAVKPETERYRPADEMKCQALARYGMAVECIVRGTLKEKNAANPEPRQAQPDEGQEDELSGAKTTETPEPEFYPSSKLHEILDWGPAGPEWAK